MNIFIRTDSHTPFTWRSRVVLRKDERIPIGHTVFSGILRCGSSGCFPCLQHIISQLREIEASPDFFKSKLVAIRGEMTTLFPSYSEDNYSYGSTSYSLWNQAFNTSIVKSAVQVCQRNEDYKFTVFGSSSGWLVFYAALSRGIQCEGYEILKPLHNVSSCNISCARLH